MVAAVKAGSEASPDITARPSAVKQKPGQRSSRQPRVGREAPSAGSPLRRKVPGGRRFVCGPRAREARARVEEGGSSDAIHACALAHPSTTLSSAAAEAVPVPSSNQLQRGGRSKGPREAKPKPRRQGCGGRRRPRWWRVPFCRRDDNRTPGDVMVSGNRNHRAIRAPTDYSTMSTGLLSRQLHAIAACSGRACCLRQLTATPQHTHRTITATLHSPGHNPVREGLDRIVAAHDRVSGRPGLRNRAEFLLL